MASTPVSGSITSDTTWTATNSPYQLTGTVTIPQGVTLTIEPGVTVNFNHNTIQVSGTLNARGTNGNRIVFNAADFAPHITEQIVFLKSSTRRSEEAGSGCIVENAFFNSTNVIVNGGSPKILGNEFYTKDIAIDVNGGSPTILNNTINVEYSAYATGLSVFSVYSVVSGNTINGSYYAMYVGETAYVTNNQITNCFAGIDASGNASIEGNVILNCSRVGISSHDENVEIRHNYIAGNDAGIVGAAIIEDNTITGNNFGLQNPISENLTNPLLSNNNIVGNHKNSIRLDKVGDVNATNNWWGTVDSKAINKTLSISANSSVTYVPFLAAPSQTAPANAESASVPFAPPTPPDTSQKTTTKSSSSTHSAPAPTQKPAEHTQPAAKPSPTAQPTPTTHPTPSPTKSSTVRILSESSLYPILKVLLLTLVAASAVVLLFYAARISLSEKRQKAAQARENSGK